MAPAGLWQFGKVLVARFMFFEADLTCLLDTSTHRHVRCIFQFDLKKENKLFEQVSVLEEKEARIAAHQKTEIQKPSQDRLAEIVRVLIAVFRKANFCQDDVQPRYEVDWREQDWLIGIEPR